jgi:hypothetical protein
MAGSHPQHCRIRGILVAGVTHSPVSDETYPLAEASKTYQRVVDGAPRRPDDVTAPSPPLSNRCGCGL